MPSVPTRRAVLTVAGVVAAGGIATGGVLAATGADAASGGSGSSAPKPPAGAPAPGGARYDTDGTVTAVSTTALTVRSQFGTSRTYALTSSTTVHAGPGRTASRASIAKGEHVAVHATKTSSGLRATDVDLRPAHIDGAVTRESGSTITVTDPDGFTRTVSTTSATKYTLDGKSASSSAVTGGRVVHAQGKVDADGTTLDATEVDVLTKAPVPPAGEPMGRPAGPGRHGPGAPGHGTAPKAQPSSGSGHAS